MFNYYEATTKKEALESAMGWCSCTQWAGPQHFHSAA